MAGIIPKSAYVSGDLDTEKREKIIKDFNPDAVIGTGGYVSAPLLYAAGKMNIPIFMQEGNAIPGKVTKMFSKKAKRIFIFFFFFLSY